MERYEFHIKGRLSDSLCRAFEDFNSAIKSAETVMRGEVRDQSELHGVVERIESLGLELVELRKARTDEDSLARTAAGFLASRALPPPPGEVRNSKSSPFPARGRRLPWRCPGGYPCR